MEKHGVVYLIEDVAEMDQCQFVYPARNGGKPRRCKRDGKYRIGQTVFLCGIHTPGVGRCFRGGNPVVVESHLTKRAADLPLCRECGVDLADESGLCSECEARVSASR